MNKKQLKLACAAISVGIAAFGLLGAAWSTETDAVKNLLEKRTHIMENVLTGKITYDEGKEQLKEIETGALYSEDLENLQKYRDTDVDRVRDMKVTAIEKKSQIYDLMTFHGEICWTCYGYEGQYTEVAEYQIGVTDSGSEYKLISLKIQRKQ